MCRSPLWVARPRPNVRLGTPYHVRLVAGSLQHFRGRRGFRPPAGHPARPCGPVVPAASDRYHVPGVGGDPARASSVRSQLSRTRLGAPDAATRSIASPTSSVVVTYFGNNAFQTG